jgi:hypothetical protein
VGHERLVLDRGPVLSGTRIRVRGDLFHGEVPEAAVYIGRAAPGLPASPYANPFPVKVHGRAGSLRLYREHLAARPDLLLAIRRDIGPDRDVACWCPLGTPCHGDVVLEVAAGADPL